MLSGFAIMIYMRLDQIMLAKMRGDAEVASSPQRCVSQRCGILSPQRYVSLLLSLIRKQRLDTAAYETSDRTTYDKCWIGLCIDCRARPYSSLAIQPSYWRGLRRSRRCLEITLATLCPWCSSLVLFDQRRVHLLLLFVDLSGGHSQHCSEPFSHSKVWSSRRCRYRAEPNALSLPFLVSLGAHTTKRSASASGCSPALACNLLFCATQEGR